MISRVGHENTWESSLGIAGRVQADLVLAATPPQAPLPGLTPRETGVTALSAHGWDTNVNLILLASASVLKGAELLVFS